MSIEDKLHSYRSNKIEDESFLVDDIMSGVPKKKKNTTSIPAPQQTRNQQLTNPDVNLPTRLANNLSSNRKYICMVGNCSGAIDKKPLPKPNVQLDHKQRYQRIN